MATINDTNGTSMTLDSNGVSFTGPDQQPGTPSAFSGSIGINGLQLRMPGLTVGGDYSGNTSVGVGPVSTTFSPNGSYTSTFSLGPLVVTTSGPAAGQVTSGSVSVGVGGASYTDTFYTDQNGHLIEQNTTQLPGQDPVIGPPHDLNTPQGVADSDAGRLVNQLTGGLVDKIRDYYERQRRAIEEATEIDPHAKTTNDAAKATLAPRYDPLTLDLDGDGLETTGIAATNPILFDHDGDGIKNGTGWVNADDGFLVRDVNGNGSIDNGRELFGDSTIKSNGQLATDGFDALADLDSISNGGNADGRISSADAQFTNLRVWRDLNQDGISQSNELFTLSSQNIASINVTKTANSQTLANGSGRVAVQQRGTHRRTPCGCNQIADLGTFTRTDGSTGTAGAVTGNLADINLASDTFHRTFPNVLDTTSVATLPDMQACPERSRRSSGAVRDLREAANDAGWRVRA